MANKILTWSRNDLLSYVNENFVDFIAKCSTSWHFLGIKAFLENLHEKEDRVFTGILTISAHGSSYGLDLSQINIPKYIHLTVVYMEASEESNKRQLLLQAIKAPSKRATSGRNIYILSPNDGWYLMISNIDKQVYNPISVIIDEGFSQYITRRQWIMNSCQSDSPIKKSSYVFAQYIFNDILRRKSVEKEIVYTIFDKKNGMKVNLNVVNYYRKVLVSEINVSCSEIIDIMFLTQPFIEDGHITFENMKNFYDSYLEMDTKHQTSFKIHPRDVVGSNYLKDKASVIDFYGMNAEELYCAMRIKPRFVVGFNSTSLIILSVFFGAKAISLTHLLKSKIQDKSWRESFDSFEYFYQGKVEFPNDFLELRNLLERS